MSQFSNKDIEAARLYNEFVKQCINNNIKADIEFKAEGTRYVSERKILPREYEVEKIIEYLVKKLNITAIELRRKGSSKYTKQRAVLVLLMRCFCNYRYKDICSVIGNITQSRISNLCSLAMKVIKENEYKGIVEEFISVAA